MKKKSATVLFFGNERLATGVTSEVTTLKSLISSGYEVVAVIANNDDARSRTSRSLEIAEVAMQHHIPLLLPEKLLDIAQEIKNYKADIGVLVAYGKIVPQSIIDLFPHGIINIHPSQLPRHRGPTPVESLILSGEEKSAVSIMALAKEMDAGPVYAQTMFEIGTNDSKQQITDKVLTIGSSLLIEILPKIINGELTPKEQEESLATYDKKIKKEDGLVDWHKTANEIQREIRAYAGWPKSKAVVGSIETIITDAVASKENGTIGSILVKEDRLIVYCGEGALEIKSLKPIGKQEMAVSSFINGYKNRL